MSKNILIIDDNEPTLKLLGEIVEGAGYKAILAIDGDIALKMIQDHEINCALVDQYMEPMNGFSFARQCKMREYKFPLVMVTANEASDLLLEAQRNGFKTVLMKPVDPAHLLKLLERLCR